MAKKRNCRRTEDENKIHEKAVKIRKMTDEQLVHYIEDRVEKARSEGFNQGKKQRPQDPDQSAKRFLDELQQKKLQGIGAVTINKLIRAAIDYGYIQ